MCTAAAGACGVMMLQSPLNERGAHLVVDGIFGPLTRRAVRRFQRGAGLTADGVAGPRTVSAALSGGGKFGLPGAGAAPGAGPGQPTSRRRALRRAGGGSKFPIAGTAPRPGGQKFPMPLPTAGLSAARLRRARQRAERAPAGLGPPLAPDRGDDQVPVPARVVEVVAQPASTSKRARAGGKRLVVVSAVSR